MTEVQCDRDDCLFNDPVKWKGNCLFALITITKYGCYQYEQKAPNKDMISLYLSALEKEKIRRKRLGGKDYGTL